MIQNLKQLKQIIQYSAERMYFGDWTPKELDKMYRKTSLNLKDQGSGKPRRLRINYSTLISFCLDVFLSLRVVKAWVHFETGREGV